MARAKRTSTERAAARRRYRAVTDPAILEAEEEAPANGPGRVTKPARPTGDVARMGIVAALRASIHPVRVRDDLAVLPSLAINKALWLPVLVTVVSTVAIAAADAGNAVTAILLAYFIQTPAIGGVFLAGFLAPRASWLLGGLVGLVAAVCYAILLFAFPLKIAASIPTAAVAESVALSAFVLSPIMGALFASAAAWYRRFLSLTNPNRGRRSQGPQKRVGDGRTRGANGQKASTKAPARR